MALSKLSGDAQCIIFSQLCNVLDPGVAVAFGSASNTLQALTQAPRQQLRADHEVAAALCLKLKMRSCKELREAKVVSWSYKDLSTADLALLGTLGLVLPALETLYLTEPTAGLDGMQWLAERLGAGALPAVTFLQLVGVMDDAGATALAAALGRGALPRLKHLRLCSAGIGDAGLVALAPALRRLPALETLDLMGIPFGDEGFAALLPPPPPTGGLAILALEILALRNNPFVRNNPFGDEGLAAIVAPPPPAGAPSLPKGGLTKLKTLDLSFTKITDAGCATLAAALDSDYPRLSATLCDPLRIGNLCIPSVSAFAMEHKDKHELAHASTALLDREARLQEEDAQVVAWQARRRITVDDMRYSQLPSAFRIGAKFEQHNIFWRVKQVGRRLTDGPAGRTHTYVAFHEHGPSFLSAERAVMEAVEMAGFVNVCDAMEEAYSLEDVMSEEMAKGLAADEGLCLARSTEQGHTTGFVGVDFLRGGRHFQACVRTAPGSRGWQSIGVFTGRFEAALQRARVTQHKILKLNTIHCDRFCLSGAEKAGRRSGGQIPTPGHPCAWVHRICVTVC